MIDDDEDANADFEEEDFSGFSIVDANGACVDEIKKLVRLANDRIFEPAAGSPVAENEATVILENPADILPEAGELLSLKLSDESGEVFWGAQKIGSLKSAFVKKLKEQRKGAYARAFFRSSDIPVMIRIVFFGRKVKDAVQI